MEEAAFSESLHRLKESFLFAAAQGGSCEDCESLLEIGADPQWRSPEGDTPLLAAARRGHCEAMQTLLVHGADVDATGKDSMTALHICCQRGDYKALNILLQANPALAKRTESGKTALEIAESKGFDDICSRLTTLLVSSGHENSIWHGNKSNTNSRSGVKDTEGKLLKEKRKVKSSENASMNNDARTPTLPALKQGESTTSRKGSNSVSSHTSYQLMGSSSHIDDNSTMRKQLDKEIREKKALESKVAALQAHVSELRTENASAVLHIDELQEKMELLNDQLGVLKHANVDSLLTVADCESMEAKLKQSLSAIEKKKNQLMAQEMEKHKESRLCVICQEGEKSVVLFPCRHMCLCDACSQHDDLHQCPLCRRPIVQKISVYS